MTPAGIEPETLRFVSEYLHRCVTAVPEGYTFGYLTTLDQLESLLNV
jgi:hypothetical protein